MRQNSMLLLEQLSSLCDKVGALFVLPCTVSNGLTPPPNQLASRKWKEYIAKKPKTISVPDVDVKGEYSSYYLLLQGNGKKRCKATLLHSANQINGSFALSFIHGKMKTKTEEATLSFPFDFSSLPSFSEEQVLQREKQLASIQVLALKECLKRRKAASQPAAVSADELKSLLVLTRERFLGHFDALAPKAVLTQTDKMKSAGTVNDARTVEPYSSSLMETNPLEWPERHVLQNLETFEKAKQKMRTGSLPRSSEQLLGHKEGPRDSITLLDAKELLKYFTSDGLPVGDLQPLQIQRGEKTFVLTPELSPRKLQVLPFEKGENKENREKRTERETSRGRGNNNRKGRGGSRGREFKGEENGFDYNQGDKPSERGKRTRGRGFGRGRGRGAGRFSSQSMGTFNPADYSDSASTNGCGTKSGVWEAAQNSKNESPEGITKPHSVSQELPDKSSYGLKGAWKNSVEEWPAEDWTEDLSETKVFTASSVPAENHITPGQSIDLVALLQKPVPPSQAAEASSFETSQQQGFGQALVFTNSQHSNEMAPGTGSSTSANAYSPHSLSSVLGSGFGELAPSKMVNISNSQILDKLKATSMSPFTTTSGAQQNSTSPPATTASWDLKPSASQSVLNHFDFKSQPEPSPVLSQLSQRQQHQTPAVSVPPPGLESFPSQAKHRESTPGDGPSSTVNRLLQLPSMAVENIVSAHQPQPKHIKLPKRRIPPASKVPASAVEMPGSTDVTGLNVQFGALEFGSEPSLSEFGPAASGSENSCQSPISLYPTSLSDPLNTSLPMTSAVQNSTYTTSVITSSSLSSSSLSSASPVTTSSSYDQSSVHTRIAYQSSASPPDPAPGSVANGHGGGRSQHIVDSTSSALEPKTTDPPALPSVGSLPSTTSCTVLLPSTSQHTATLPSLSQAGDLSSSPLSQLSSSLSSHQNSLSSAHAARPASTPHTHASVESTPSSATFSTAATSAPSAPSSGVVLPGNSLCLGGTTVSVPSNSTRATALVTSGKAPPNLPQGVPPLLHNQYLVGPGGLLPAYPIYGYDELQMLQSRLPMDYYGIPFAAPTALASRDGSLANNPYSGDVTKFGRGDSASPAPPTTPAQAQQSQSQTHHTAQQPFLNPALPPGYSYTGLPYYTGVPSAFQYGPTMFVPSTSAKQHGVTLSTPPTPFQQASGYGQHTYSTGYDDLTPGTAAGDYTKGGYGGSSQAPNKSAGSGPGKGVSVSSGTTGLPDMTGSVYNKTQNFDKQGFHAGTPPPFNLPSALGSTGPLAPGAAAGYAPAPFLHIMPAHQQPHSQLLHHHLPQDTPSGSGQRSQPSSLQPKSQASKPTYGSSPYWTN